MKNKFSDEVTKEKMLDAKENILETMVRFLSKETKSVDHAYLEKYLNNFYMFIETLSQMVPDKRATLTNGELQQIKIENNMIYNICYMLF